jgi:hypothetical protein
LFSPGTPVSATNKTDRHDIAEILLKVALNTITPNQTDSNPNVGVKHQAINQSIKNVRIINHLQTISPVMDFILITPSIR